VHFGWFGGVGRWAEAIGLDWKYQELVRIHYAPQRMRIEEEVPRFIMAYNADSLIHIHSSSNITHCSVLRSDHSVYSCPSVAGQYVCVRAQNKPMSCIGRVWC
jgi:hypothetical protein